MAFCFGDYGSSDSDEEYLFEQLNNLHIENDEYKEENEIIRIELTNVEEESLETIIEKWKKNVHSLAFYKKLLTEDPEIKRNHPEMKTNYEFEYYYNDEKVDRKFDIYCFTKIYPFRTKNSASKNLISDLPFDIKNDGMILSWDKEDEERYLFGDPYDNKLTTINNIYIDDATKIHCMTEEPGYYSMTFGFVNSGNDIGTSVQFTQFLTAAKILFKNECYRKIITICLMKHLATLHAIEMFHYDIVDPNSFSVLELKDNYEFIEKDYQDEDNLINQNIVYYYFNFIDPYDYSYKVSIWLVSEGNKQNNMFYFKNIPDSLKFNYHGSNIHERNSKLLMPMVFEHDISALINYFHENA